MQPLAKLVLVMALAGCQSPGGGYDERAGYEQWGRRHVPAPEEMISTDADAYGAGATISVRLTNRTVRTVSYNLCRSQLQRRDNNNEWVAARSSLGEACTAELRGLSPGQSARFSFPVPGSMRSAPYRIRTELRDSRGGPPIEAVSNAFTLQTRERSD